MFRRIGIVSKMHEPAVRDALTSVLAVLNARGCEVRIDAQVGTDGVIGTVERVPREELPASSDLLISIGGDGTLLQCAGLIYPRDVALLGINLGRLGFLTDLLPTEIESGLNAVLDGEYQAEERAVLGCDVIREGRVIASEDGLNDVVVQKWNTARLITLNTFVDGKFLHSQRSDGMIVATPTGSTAYALSGGGPILDPSIRALALVPICPHTLTNRPIVVSDTAHIEMHVATDREDESRVTCDGNSFQELLPGDRVHVFRRQQAVRLIHPASHDHFATLRAKLNWGRYPC
ncbi:MAG: NAD(+) kinase [Gammaproteobacteria bacterium]